MQNIIPQDATTTPLQCPAWCQTSPEAHAADNSWYSHRAVVGTVEDVESESVTVEVSDLQVWTEHLGPDDAPNDRAVQIDDRLYNLAQAKALLVLLDQAIRLLESGQQSLLARHPYPMTPSGLTRGLGTWVDDNGIHVVLPEFATPWTADPTTVAYEQRDERTHAEDQGVAYELRIDTWTDAPSSETSSYSELTVDLMAFVHDLGGARWAPEVDIRKDGSAPLSVTAPDARRLAAALTRAADLIEGDNR